MEVQRDIIYNLECCTNVAVQELSFMVSFLKDEKNIHSKVMDVREDNSFLKVFELFKSRKDSTKETDKEKSLGSIREWNPNAFLFFESLTESVFDQRVALKKMQVVLDQLYGAFEKEEEDYKSFVKRTIKQFVKKYNELEDLFKDQQRIIVKYQEMNKKPTREALSVLTDLKTIQGLVIKQIAMLVERSQAIKDFAEQILKYAKKQAAMYKEYFGKYMVHHEQVYKPTTHSMGLVKVIDRMEGHQDQAKLEYFRKHILSRKAADMLGQIISTESTDDYVMVCNFLSLTEANYQELIKLAATIDHLCEQISFRRWNMELAEGWLIESWTKCLGCIALDGHFVLFGEDGKVLKVINVKVSTVSKREDTTVFLSETVKGIFSDSQQEYKVRLQTIDEVEEFELYIANQIK